MAARHEREHEWPAAQCFPKGTDLGVHTAERLATVAADLNARPRKTLGWKTPSLRLDRLLRSTA